MNRYILVCLLLVQLALGAGVQAHAPEGAEAGPDRRLDGYPTVTIRISPERIEAPDRVTAGPAIVVQENTADETGHFFVARVPDDVTEAELQELMAPETAPLAFNPEPPAWLFRSLFVGNADRAAPNGGRVAALVDLVPGRYVVLDPYRPPAEGARFEVEPGDVATHATNEAPAPDVVVQMFEMDFELPAVVPAGRHLWEVVNAGTALHEIALLPVPADATYEQVEAAVGASLQAEAAGEHFEGQPAPAGFGDSWADWRLHLVHGVGVMSPGRSTWTTFDLAPGTYAAVCFVPDPVTGTPHLMMGMTELFTVTGEAIASPAA